MKFYFLSKISKFILQVSSNVWAIDVLANHNVDEIHEAIFRGFKCGNIGLIKDKGLSFIAEVDTTTLFTSTRD